MHSKIETITNGATSALALALIETPRFVDSCTHQIETASGGSVPMRCHWTFHVEFPLALAVIVTALVLWLIRQPQARRVTGGALILLNLLVIAVPQTWVIGLCGNAEMPCHVLARWLEFWAGLLIAIGILIIATARNQAPVAMTPDPWDKPKGAG